MEIQHNIFTKKSEMSFINIKQLTKLTGSISCDEPLEKTVAKFQENYNLKVSFQDLLNLAENAKRINKREKTKEINSILSDNPTHYEIFCFGEFKIFNWVLVIYCYQRSIDLENFKEEDYEFLQSIFKSKTLEFIKYQLKDLIYGKKKMISEWSEQEENLFKQIIQSYKTEHEWKAISFELFTKSKGKYFRPFQICRQIWRNHLNPSVKKTDWTAEEDLELFSLILQHGCRWALISREFKGIRSQHSVKNRYHSVVKTMKKQYRIEDNDKLDEKIYRYLKIKLQKQENKKVALNSSVDSVDSKQSIQRSREEIKNKFNRNQSSEEFCEKIKNEKDQQNGLFQNIYEDNQNNQQLSSKINFGQEVSLLKEIYLQFKQEKKTNDKEEDEEKKTKELGKDILGENRSQVKTLSLQELEREYNRLMNFNEISESNNLCLFDEIQQLENPLPSHCWIREEEFKVSNWLDLDQ